MKRLTKTEPGLSFEGQQKIPKTSEISHLREMCLDLLKVNKEVGKLNEKKTKLMSKLNNLRLKKIPEFAKSVGLEKEKSLKDVGDLTIKDDIKAAISEANQPTAYQWLKDNKHGSIIDDDIIIDTDGKDRKKLMKQLKLLKIPFETKQSINTNRLKAFIRERIEKGDTELDQKVFGVYHFSEVKIKGVKFNS